MRGPATKGKCKQRAGSVIEKRPERAAKRCLPTISPWRKPREKIERSAGALKRMLLESTYPEPGGDARDIVEAVRHLIAQRADNPAPVKELEPGLERNRPDVLSLQTKARRDVSPAGVAVLAG